MIGKSYEYDAMATCEQSLWWYKCLHDNTFTALKRNNIFPESKILDAGCGTGGFLKRLQNEGFNNITGFDLSEDALSYARRSTDLDLKMGDITQASEYYHAESFDVIISHDILCLLPDGADRIAIRELFKLLKPGGLLIMNLPALNAFRGTHDIAVGITKRYSKADILKLLEPVGGVDEIYFWPWILSLPIYFTRLTQRVRIGVLGRQNYSSDVEMPGRFLNDMFYNVSRFERKYINSRPWGSSLFSVARKPLNHRL